MDHGNGKLWVGLSLDGRTIARATDLRPDGSFVIKFGWWRGVKGNLVITGRRLDGVAQPAYGDVPPNYGDQGFQATGIIFPTTGCWEITGRVGDADLAFVTEVVSVEASAS
jgi:hypothetical protein